MRMFKVLCASAVVAVVWWLEISYVMPALEETCFYGVLFALCPLLVCCGVTVAAFAYVSDDRATDHGCSLDS